MVEGEWHNSVREKLKERYHNEGFEVISSHDDKKLLLFVDELKSKNCLSDVDMVLMKDGNIIKLVEIQQSLRPKEIVGIIAATNLTNKCSIAGDIYPLKDVILTIVLKKQKEESKKSQQMDLIKERLKLGEGCLKWFKFEEAD